jgi:uncharacterized protein
MNLFGPDFWAAGKGWNYPLEKLQGFWRSVGLFLGLFLLFQILQIAFGLGLYRLVFDGSFAQLQLELPEGLSNFIISSIIGMFPAALPVVFLAMYVSRFGLAKGQGQLPLRWPLLGIAGWALVVFGFVVAMAAVSSGIYGVLNLDPAKELGLVEKSMTSLAKDQLLFALALPSIVLAAPLAEEFLFRGILFAGLVNTAVGKAGAVIITSALWAVAHAGAAPWINVGLIFMMGLILGVLLLRFGSLWVTIALHTAWNAMSSLTLLGIGGHS